MSRLRQYQYFVTLAEAGSFARAAERESVSQPTLSQQIASLERSLGISLFVRGPRGVELTEAGERLLPLVAHVLADLARLASYAAALSRGKVARLRIGSPLWAVRAPGRRRLIAGFEELHPEVEIGYLNAWSPLMLQMTREGRLDATFSMSPDTEGNSDPLVVDDGPAILLMRETDPLARKSLINVGDLVERALILHPPENNRWLYDRLALPLRAAGVRTLTPEQPTLPAVVELVRSSDALFPAVPWEMPYVGPMEGLVAIPTTGEPGLRYQLFLSRSRGGAADRLVDDLWELALRQGAHQG
jgi:DNA-binding transcriptional LysR family regulator